MLRLAVDTTAIVDLLRPDRPVPPPLHGGDVIFPLPVVGELLAGARQSRRIDENLVAVEDLLVERVVLTPDLETARIYGRIRGTAYGRASASRMNDLWIAALCLQHSLPLLTNDRGFDSIDGLAVIHW
ncbi:MAG TPA: PIN domain-containing protein [Thermoanaerobaculia bacterium]|nr:PIN domain-containing protein [Thermoanaerobaculia bacterium]